MTNPAGESVRRRLALFVGGPVLLVVAVVVGIVAFTTVGEPTAEEPAPLDLATLSHDIAGHYRSAAEHPDAYQNVPCFCGCQEFLGHRDLYDCFVRADDAGWEAHAARCGVCIAESTLVLEQLDAGATPDQARNAVLDRFGTTPPTVPPAS